MQSIISQRKEYDLTCMLQKVDRDTVDINYNMLFPLVYDQLLAIAQKRLLREQGNHTYSRTDLVHEAYFQLIDVHGVNWSDRSHFYAIASRCMRRILIDHARKKKAAKRGGNQTPDTFQDDYMQDDFLKMQDEADKLISLDEALAKLATLNQRLADVVDCRYFGELSIEETAHALDISVSTVKRDWAKARGWLYNQLKED